MEWGYSCEIYDVFQYKMSYPYITTPAKCLEKAQIWIVWDNGLKRSFCAKCFKDYQKLYNPKPPRYHQVSESEVKMRKALG